MTRGFPNGETHADKIGVRPAESIGGYERTQGSEPSQYLEEKKETSIPKVVASEIGRAQTCRTQEAIKSRMTLQKPETTDPARRHPRNGVPNKSRAAQGDLTASGCDRGCRVRNK